MDKRKPLVTISPRKCNSCSIYLNQSFLTTYPTSSFRFNLNDGFRIIINRAGNKITKSGNGSWKFTDNIEANDMCGKYLVEEIDKNCFELIKLT